MANYVKVTRALELIMGIYVPGHSLSGPEIKTSNFTAAIVSAVQANKDNPLFNSAVRSALSAAVPLLNGIGAREHIPNIFDFHAPDAPLNSSPGKDLLVTKCVRRDTFATNWI